MVKFTKMQAIGNDFICINYEDVKQYNMKIFSKFVCDRHFGIGADGLILYSGSRIANFKMRIFNSDGSEAEMCGNGIRCLSKFLYDNNYIEGDKIYIETLAGIKEVGLIVENEKIMSIKVKIGKPIIDINKLPVYIPRNYRYNKGQCKLLFRLGDNDIVGSFLSVGNPHTVIEVNDLKNYPVTKYGKIVENYKYFPQKSNVEFVKIIDENHIKIRVWERGVGETFGCGTGAVASCYSLYKENKIGNNVNVELKGGNVEINIEEKTDIVWLEGTAVNVYDGKIDL